MKEYYRWENNFYCVTRKGRNIKEVVCVYKTSIEYTTDFSEDYINHCKPCTKAQFQKAGKRVVDKILKAIE